MLLCGSRRGLRSVKRSSADLPTAQVFGNLGKEQKSHLKTVLWNINLLFMRCISAPGTSGCLHWVSKRQVEFNFVEICL